MKVALGVDTLSYHCRIEAAEITIEEVFREVRDLDASYVQLDLHHVRGRSLRELEKLRHDADELGLGILASGAFIGTPRSGDTPADGMGRIARWVTSAQAVGSPIVRVASGFYRAELAGDADAIRAEQRYVIESLQLATERIDMADVTVVLENHSDFTPAEYVQIVEAVGPDRIGVFLDLINPVAVLADPLATVAELVPYAVAGHVKDYRFESHYVDDRYHRRGFDVLWCYPGEGVADLASLLLFLRDKPGGDVYRLAIEGLDSRAGVADQKARLGRSLDLLRELLGADLAARAES